MSPVWPDREDGVQEQWMRFHLHVDMSADNEEADYALMQVDINVSFLMSSWACIFGSGCPSTMVTGIRPDHGCCQIGVNFSETHDGEPASVDFKRVRKAVKKLTAADCDNIADVKNDKWYRTDKHGNPTHTRVKDGLCIFGNRADGPAGKPGCALHALAKRTGVHASETKPAICWQVPFGIAMEYDTKKDTYYTTVDCTRPGTWGYEHNDSSHHIGWFCTAAPEAYETGAGMVYRTAELELRKMLGDYVYEQIRDRLDKIVAATPMPAVQVNKRLPAFITERIKTWEELQGEGDRASMRALKNINKDFVDQLVKDGTNVE